MAAATFEGPQQNKLPHITTGIYAGKYTDRNQEINAAGKLTATGDSAVNCMNPPQRPTSPAVVRKFRATLRPDAGKKRVFYGKADDSHLQWAEEMTHGVAVAPSIVAGSLLNPDPNTLFRQRLYDKKESIYASHVRAPLGVSHDQTPRLPAGLDRFDFTFGIRTEKDGSAGELVSPDKTRQQVEEEYEDKRDMYRESHKAFRVAEQKRRNYVQPSYDPSGMYGIPTPHDNAGGHVRSTLRWLHDERCEKRAPVVSKFVDDFRERTQPQLGQVHDPIKDTLRVAPDHTFGILIKPDEYGAGDLLHCRTPGTYLRGHDRQRGLISAMRQHLKKANYHNFADLLSAFRFYDKDDTGRITLDNLREACVQFNLPIEPAPLEQMMSYCDTDGDGMINYIEFANFLNWKDKLPSGLTPPRPSARDTAQSAPPVVDNHPQERSNSPATLQKQIDRAVGDHRTSASMINAVVGGISTRDYRRYGVPTVRTDLPAPRVKRVSDHKNYGDEGDAYGLVNPSVHSTRGVTERDFLLPRSKTEIRDLFTGIGLSLSYETFDNLYATAAARHPRGFVSLEGFRAVLDDAHAMSLSKTAIL